MLLPLALPLLLPLAYLALQLSLLVAQGGGALEVLIAYGLLLVAVDGLQLRLEVGYFRRRDLCREPGTRGGFVDHVDRLVGQEAVRDVALGEPRSDLQDLVGDDHPVVVLVALPQALEDIDRLVDRGWVDDHRLEAPLQGSVLLDVLAVFVESRCANALELAACQRRLEHVGGVDGTLGRARAHQGVQLVDEQHDVLVLYDLVHHGLEPLLELPAILRAGDDRSHVECEHPVAGQRLRAVARGNQLREALHYRGLSHTGLPDQHRVVLLAAGEDLDDALDLLGTADGGVELPFTRERSQVAAEVIQRGRLRLLLGAGRSAGRGRAFAAGGHVGPQ